MMPCGMDDNAPIACIDLPVYERAAHKRTLQ